MVRLLLKLLFLIFITMFVTTGDVLAQCAMCKASVETNVNVDGIGFAARLNTGILYLFVTPYLLALVIGISWYRKSRQHRKDLEEAEMRKRRVMNI